MNRRKFLKNIAYTNALIGAGAFIPSDGKTAEGIHTGSKISEGVPTVRGGTVILEGDKVIQPQREIPVIADTDVLVVGGGCAGVLAAIAAARAGAKTAIVERYGCFGGLWTAGQVLIILATHYKQNDQQTKCVRGIADEMFERLTKIKHGIINQAPGKHNPTSDPEATKYILAKMLREAGVDILLHSWVTNSIMDGSTVKGAIFESKWGCHAIRSKVVIDATGDGDVFDAANAESIQHVHRIGLVHRLGNVPRDDKSPRGGIGSATPISGVRWVNMRGPVGDSLDVRTLTQSDLDGREAIWKKLMAIQQKPGHGNVFLLDVASQLGVRASRTLVGEHEVLIQDAKKHRKYKDVIAVGGTDFIKGPVQIPYGALVPKKIDGLLAAGRCISADNLMLNYTRLIGPAMLTGQAAGVAAAVAVKTNSKLRDVNVPSVQDILRKQGAYLG